MTRFFAVVLVIFYCSNALAAPHAQRLSGWEAFNELVRGNKRYVGYRLEELGQDPQIRHSQEINAFPHSMIITSSDSRVVPELVFNQGPGRLVTTRMLAASVTDDLVASIEHAVAVQGVRFVFVMWLDRDPILVKALESPNSNDPDFVNILVSNFRKALNKNPKSLHWKTSKKSPTQEYVAALVQEVVERSELVRRYIQSRQLVIGQAIFHLKTGKVDFFKVGQPELFDSRVRWLQKGRSGFDSKGSGKNLPEHAPDYFR